MNNPLGDALMVKVEDFFAQHEILEQRRAARARLEAILIVADRNPVIGGQPAVLLMRLAAMASGNGGGGGAQGVR